MITPFTPTAEELAHFERLRARNTFPAVSATLDAACHTQSTGSPAAPQGYHSSTQTAAGALPQRAPLAPCVITAAQLRDLKIPRRPALLDRWLCEGDLGYIFAPRGVGKTWMAMALPGAISRRCALGLWTAGVNDSATASDGTAMDLAPEPGSACVPVLYVDGEMPLQLTQYRSGGLQLDLGPVSYIHHEHVFQTQGTSLNIGEQADRDAITTLLLEQGHKVLILDNLSSLASGVDENKGNDYEPISHWLLELRRRKITVIVIHHAGRNGCMRGHTKREDACSWILELRDARQEDESGAKFVSHFTKPSRNTGESLPDLLWHFTSDKDGQTQIHCEIAQHNDYEEFIQHVIEGVTCQKDIAEMMDKNKGTISKWARRAIEERRIGGSPNKMLPLKDPTPGPRAKIRTHASDDDFEEEDEL